MIKDIVVNLSLGARDPAGDYAVSMAEACDAHVLGVAFAYEPVIPGSAMGGIPAEFLDAQRREAGDKARKAVARFTEAARRAGVSAETRILEASISGAADQLGHLARRFDIAVAGQPAREHPAAEEVVDEGVLFESGRPVVFVPFIHNGGMKFEPRDGLLGRQPRRHPRHRRQPAAAQKSQVGRDRHRRRQAGTER